MSREMQGPAARADKAVGRRSKGRLAPCMGRASLAADQLAGTLLAVQLAEEFRSTRTPEVFG